MSEPLRAGARLWDAAALALVLAGAAVYVRASAGMQHLTANPVGGGSFVDANLAAWKSHRDTGNIGLTMVGVGIVIGIVSYLRARRAASSPTS